MASYEDEISRPHGTSKFFLEEDVVADTESLKMATNAYTAACRVLSIDRDAAKQRFSDAKLTFVNTQGGSGAEPVSISLTERQFFKFLSYVMDDSANTIHRIIQKHDGIGTEEN